MKAIIDPVPVELIKGELTADKFLRKSNYGSNHIYVLTAHDSPNVMREIGRLREVAFRAAGGGTGKEADIDKYDEADSPYKQLIVWDPEGHRILGGYRYILCRDAQVDEKGDFHLATGGLLKFSERFKTEYVPHMIELGRSFVVPDYQSTNANRKSLFTLDNLWDGLGALVIENPDMKYFFGKVTMYTHFNKYARDLILYFLRTFFGDKDQLVYPHKPLALYTPEEQLQGIFVKDTFQENLRILSQRVRENGENIPPLINSYMGLSSTMRSFGTSINTHFGDVEETGILLTIDDIYEKKKERHFVSYLEEKKQRGKA